MALTETSLKNAEPAEKAHKLADGYGMFLLVNPNGSQLWRLKCLCAGKEKRLALGDYPEVSLKQAREYRDDAHRLLNEGKAPATERKATKRSMRPRVENAFEQVAREFVQQQKAAIARTNSPASACALFCSRRLAAASTAWIAAGAGLRASAVSSALH